jgi:hypothetical protein
MGKFAQNTSVSVDKSKAQIENTLDKYGAAGFSYGKARGKAIVGFELNDRFVKFTLNLPDKAERRFTHTPGRDTERSNTKALQAWEQGCRSSWRALNLVIHAKLEAVAAGITTFEEEFMAHILLPSGRTVGETLIPQIETAYKDGKTMPLLLPYAQKGPR